MLEELYIKRRTQAAELNAARKVARGLVRSMRFHARWKGSKKHAKGAEKPKEIDYSKKADPDQDAYNLAHAKYWGVLPRYLAAKSREARISHLAAMFLKGRPYHEVENTSVALGVKVMAPAYQHPTDHTLDRNAHLTTLGFIFNEVQKEAKKYYEGDPRHFNQKYEEWFSGAVAHLKSQEPKEEPKAA